MDKSRPFPLRMIIALQLVQLLGLMVVLLLVENPTMEPFRSLPLSSRQITAGITILSSILIALSVIGIWNYRHWGWVLLMLRLGLDLSSGIWTYFNEEPNFVSMGIAVVTVLYLNRRDVKQLFAKPERST